MSNGCSFGFNNVPGCEGQAAGDFNLFSWRGAPSGDSEFVLASGSETYRITSIAPLGYYSYNTGVPEPGVWASLILGPGVVGGTLRRRSKQRVSLIYA